MSLRPALLLLAWAAVLFACDNNDIGKDCPELLADADPTEPEGGRTVTEEVVGHDAGFPCRELICIATAGRSGYCSKRCREDAGCPDGFECREIQPVGLFAGEKYCAWKPCEKRSDCGNVEDFCCIAVPAADPLGDRKYCDFAVDGKCE